MRTKWLVMGTVACVAFGGLMIYSTTAAPSSESTKAEIGKSAPDFTLKDAYGKSFSLGEFKDQIVVLEWINEDCPVSKRCHDQGLMQETYAKYAGKGVVWLAIDTTPGHKPAGNRVYAAKQKLAYPILHDADGKVGKTYGAATTPHMFVIDKSGKLVYDGALDDDPRGGSDSRQDYVAAAIDATLAGKEPAKSKTKPYGCSVKYPR